MTLRPPPSPSFLAACCALALSACSARSTSQGQPSQTFQGLTMTRTSAGDAQWTLHARQASVNERDGAVEFQAPEVALFDGGKVVPDVASRRGFFHQKTQDLSLEGSVLVTGHDASGKAGGKITLRTDALDYVSTERVFRTDRAVLIERPGSRMKGRGLVANHDLSEIRIKEQEAVFE